MRNIALIITCLIATSILSTAFTPSKKDEETKKDISLKGNEEFIFGEFTDKKSKIKIKNSGASIVQLKVLDETTKEPLMQYTLEPDESFTVFVFGWEKILVQNPNDEDVSISVESKRLYTGYRIQEMEGEKSMKKT